MHADSMENGNFELALTQRKQCPLKRYIAGDNAAMKLY